MEGVDLKETAAIGSSHEDGGLPPQSALLIKRRGKIFPSTQLHVDISEDGTHLEATVLRNMNEFSIHRISLGTDDVDGGRGDEEEEHEVWSGVGCCSGYVDPFSRCQAKHLFKSSHTRHLHLQGRKLMGLHLFPLISRAAGELWSSFVLLLSCLLFALSLSAVILSPGGYKATNSNIIKMVIAGMALLLSIPNFVLSVRGCHLVRGPCKACKSSQTHSYSRFDEELDSRTALPRVSYLQKYWRLFRDVVYDFCRLYVAEFLIYFNLAFSILDCVKSINDLSNTGSLEKLSIAHLVVSALGFFLHVYVVRLATLSATYHSAKKTSTLRSSQESTACCSERGRCMMVFLVVYIVLDMVTQGFAFASLWLKADCENPHGSSVGTHVSAYTWAMLVVGALLFMLGSVTWCITAYVWIQEFFLHYMLGVIHKLKAAPSTDKEKSATLDGVLTSVPEEDKRSDVGGCCRKLLFPLHTPRLILPSCLYFLTWITFFVLIFIGADEDGDQLICSRDRKTYSLFTTFSAIIVFGNVASNLMNLPVVLVGAIWSTIALVCLLLLLLLLVCFLSFLLAAALPVLLVVLLVLCLCHDPVCD